ncbi:MAG: InlB B-repeat-containing protein [Clostridia bacterium]
MKKFRLLLALVLVFALASTLVACGQIYTITFDSQGGTETIAIKVEEGKLATKPADPTKVGFTFGGWYLESTFTTLYDDWTKPVTKDITLYAKWTPIEVSYTITFNSNLGSAVENIVVKSGLTATAPANPTREGYEFDGWYTDMLFTNQYDWSTAVTADIELLAKWNKISYVITFDSQEGSNVAKLTIDYNAVATKPADPTREGHIFRGWFTDNQFTTEYNWASVVTADMKLFAKWEKATYSVTFVLNDGVINAGGVTQYVYGSTTTLPTDVTKLDSKFGGWYANEKFDGAPILTINPSDVGDKTYYAKWEENLGNLSSYIEGFENSTLLPLPGKYGSYSNRPDVKLGQFSWSISASTVNNDANDRKFGDTSARLRGSNKDETNPNKIELNTYVNGLIQITFMYGSYSGHEGGIIHVYYQVEGSQVWVELGSVTALKWADINEMSLAKFTIPVEARTQNIRFKIEKEINTTKSTSVSIDNITMNFLADAYSVVSYETNGGGYIDSALLANNAVLTKPVDPIKELHGFMGWFTDDKFTTAYDFAKPVTASMKLFAKWEAYTVQSLTLSLTNVKVKFYPTQAFEYDNLIVTAHYSNNQDVVVTNYVIKIFDSANVEVTDFLAAAAGTYTVKITFAEGETSYTITKYAEAAPIYDVTFVKYDGTTDKIVKVSQGEFASVADPVCEGKMFMGWFTDATCLTLADITTVEITAATSFYALWLDKYVQDFENASWDSFSYNNRSVADLLIWSVSGSVNRTDVKDHKIGTGALRLRSNTKDASNINRLELTNYITGVKTITFSYGSYGTHKDGDIALYYQIKGTTTWTKVGESLIVAAWDDPTGLVLAKFDVSATAGQSVRFKIEKAIFDGGSSVNIDNLTFWACGIAQLPAGTGANSSGQVDTVINTAILNDKATLMCKKCRALTTGK